MAVFGRFDAVREQLVRMGILDTVLDYIEEVMKPARIRSLASGLLPFTEEIDGKSGYATVQRVPLRERALRSYESHRVYVDIHIILQGEELIEVAESTQLTSQGEYNTEKDYILYDGAVYGVTVHLKPGMIAVFFPSDAHMPGIAPPSAKQDMVLKVVVKQKL